MVEKKTALTTIRSAIAAIFAALVCVATVILSIYVPQTRGYFNIGETMVYTTALLFGPIIGAFAGGVGSMFADLILGYSVYAPATLVIKACEGFVVGFLAGKTPEAGSKARWLFFTLAMGTLSGAALGYVGASYYSGPITLDLGLPFWGMTTLDFTIPVEFWIVLAGLIILLTGVVAVISEPRLGWMVLSIFVGGAVMVSGYFFYQQFFLDVAAFFEIPFNIAQMLVGMVIAVPLTRIIRRSIPSIKELGL
ncbi:MAG: ECF transporter S component [Candidatus Bathyarchaeota archaeon]|nr:MAG: ECF transporter S component [Candidatus Bathyarchaeota archaeon]